MAERLYLWEQNLRDIGMDERNIRTIRKLAEFIDAQNRLAEAEVSLTEKQPLASALTGFSTLASTAGLVEQTADDVFAIRLLGAGASTSVPTRADADSRYAQLSGATFTGAVQATEYRVSGTKVVGAQGAAVADASGGATIDAEARTAINTLLARLRTHGLIAT